MILWFLACSSMQKTTSDTSLDSSTSVSGGIDRSVDRDLQLITCIQFERINWKEVDMCKVHLQFYVPDPYEHVEIDPVAHGEVCVLEQDIPEPPLFTPFGIDAGEKVTLFNDYREIVMFRSTSEIDGISYFMNDCNEETFPFGESFALQVSGSSLSNGVPPFVLSEAISFGVDMTWDTPISQREVLDFSSDMSLDWSFGQALPEVAHRKHQILVESDQERLRCEPQEEEIIIPQSDLQMMEEIPDSARLVYDKMTFGPITTLPWGMEYQSVMVYRNSGEMILE